MVSCSSNKEPQYPNDPSDPWNKWHRPVVEPVFSVFDGNNHDAIIFMDDTAEYRYHLIVSARGCSKGRPKDLESTYLWRTKQFSWSSFDWELVSDHYNIGCQYEYDDGLKVKDKYYIYEEGIVYTYQGNLEDANGNWVAEGSFPKEICDDVGAYYENGLFHLFGEYGKYPYGTDGLRLAHLTSPTGLGDWTLLDTAAADPNKNGEVFYGVGDATITKIDDYYYLFSDIESRGVPYKIMTWRSESLDQRFEMVGIAMEARTGLMVNWDNERVQDGDIVYAPELERYVMVCNMRDTDGKPGGYFPTLKGFTRVLGFFYSDSTLAKN